MTALERKLWRDLRQLRGQLVAIALVVCAGIASFITLRTAWSSLSHSRDLYYREQRFPDVFATCRRAPAQLRRRIEAIAGVAAVYPRIVERVLVPMPGMREPAAGTILSLPADRPVPMLGLHLRAGRLVAPGRSDEVVVLESFARAHQLRLGQRLEVVLNGSLRRLAIVGIALSPEYVLTVPPGDFAPDDRRVAVLWMEQEALAAAFGMGDSWNDLVLRVEHGASLAAVMAQLERLLAPFGGVVVAAERQLSNYMLSSELTQLETMATTVPAIFLAVAAFLLNVALSRLVYLQRPQIATLKALGYSHRQVGWHYLQLVGLIALVGTVAGCLVGMWLGREMTGLYAAFYRFPRLVYRAEPALLTSAVAASLGAAVLGGLATVRQVVRMAPAEAMQPPAPAVYRRSWFERSGLSRHLGATALMIGRELTRRPLRTALSCLGISTGIAMVVVGNAGYDSFRYLVEGVIARERLGNVTVTLRQPAPAGVVRSFASWPGVLDAEGSRVVPVRLRHGARSRDSVIHGLPEGARLRRLVDRELRIARPPPRGLLLGRQLARSLGATTGTPLQVEVREGRQLHRTAVVVELVDDALGLQGYMRADELDRWFGEAPAVTAVELRVDDRALAQVHERLRQMRNVAGVSSTRTLMARFEQQTGQTMAVMSLILWLFAASIAAGVVYNNARVALSQRSRDLASLRVLGFRRSEVSVMLLGELAVQVLFAIPLGLLLGRWWCDLLFTSAVDPEMYRFPVHVAPASYVRAVAVTLVAALASGLLVRRKVDRLDLVGVLKARE